MSYQAFALALSLVLVVLYAGLLIIAARRATLPDRAATELIVTHARLFEGPVATLLFLLSVILFATASAIDRADYAEWIRLGGAAIRGAMLVFGVAMLGAYWQVRDTWLR